MTFNHSLCLLHDMFTLLLYFFYHEGALNDAVLCDTITMLYIIMFFMYTTCNLMFIHEQSWHLGMVYLSFDRYVATM